MAVRPQRGLAAPGALQAAPGRWPLPLARRERSAGLFAPGAGAEHHLSSGVRGGAGLSMHAAVRCGADDPQGLEQLCRYGARAALANERAMQRRRASSAEAEDALAPRT